MRSCGNSRLSSRAAKESGPDEPEHRQERREMKKAWEVSRQYDHELEIYSVTRTKARASETARELARFYRMRGYKVVSLKNGWPGDMFFVKGAHFTIHIERVEVEDRLWVML